MVIALSINQLMPIESFISDLNSVDPDQTLQNETESNLANL